MSQSIEHVTLNLGAMNLSPMLDVEFMLKKKKGKNLKINEGFP